jgi:hypothetical protein
MTIYNVTIKRGVTELSNGSSFNVSFEGRSKYWLTKDGDIVVLVVKKINKRQEYVLHRFRKTGNNYRSISKRIIPTTFQVWAAVQMINWQMQCFVVGFLDRNDVLFSLKMYRLSCETNELVANASNFEEVKVTWNYRSFSMKPSTNIEMDKNGTMVFLAPYKWKETKRFCAINYVKAFQVII